MLVIQDSVKASDLPVGCVATIGNFDGMHIGHRAIIRDVVARARSLGVPSAVITFDPHPLTVVSPDRVPRQILNLSQKEELIAACGVDALLVIHFSPEFSSWSPEKFVAEFLGARLQVREVHIGSDFCFGAGREGTVERLQHLAREYGFEVVGVDQIMMKGFRVSSSLVRDAVSRGALRAAHLVLGRTYFVDGRVETGRRLGRKMGFPTVNVGPANDLFPGSGVYVTSVRFETFSRVFESVTNIGVRPTLYENYATTIESHILDFDSNVYGDTVRVYFHRLLRREKQFRSALELTNQIRSDIDQSRRYFLRHPIDPFGVAE